MSHSKPRPQGPFSVLYAGLSCKHEHPTIAAARGCLPRRLRHYSTDYLLEDGVIITVLRSLSRH